MIEKKKFRFFVVGERVRSLASLLVGFLDGGSWRQHGHGDACPRAGGGGAT